MARPRIIKLEGGEISLTNFSPELADSIAEYIKNFNKEPKSSSVKEVTLDTLIDTALGIRIDLKTQKAQMVKVKYNGETLDSKIESIVDCEGIRDASNNFKTEAVKLKFV